MKKWHERWWIVAPVSSAVAVAGLLFFGIPGRETEPSNRSVALAEEIGPAQREQPNALESPEANGDRMSVPEQEKSEPGLITIPRSVVSEIRMQIFSENIGFFSDFAELLGIDKDQADAIGQSMYGVLDELRKIEAEHSSLETDEEGNQYFTVTPFDAEFLRERILTDLKRILKDDRAVLIEDMLDRVPAFNCFGKYAQEIAFQETFFVDIGQRATSMKVSFKMPGPKQWSYGVSAKDVETLKTRFGLIYQRAGISPFEE